MFGKDYGINDLYELNSSAGDSYYLYYPNEIRNNYNLMANSFCSKYANIIVAYAYKPNYLPNICKTINQMGGYAEISSELEYRIAKKCGVDDRHIIYNGPYTEENVLKQLIIGGGIINIDSMEEAKKVLSIAHSLKMKTNIGIRCLISTTKKRFSKFGFVPYSNEFEDIVQLAIQDAYLSLSVLHCHVKGRTLEDWEQRTKEMIKIAQYIDAKYDVKIWAIDLGGGLPVSDSSLMEVYSDTVCTVFNQEYKNSTCKPYLILEPGTAIAATAMSYVTKVINVKKRMGKNIVFLGGTASSIKALGKSYEIPIEIISIKKQEICGINDFSGITCMEDDYFSFGYEGSVGVGDYVIFHNVGVYSFVMKPPFVFGTPAIISWPDKRIVKRKETSDDMIRMFQF